MKIRLVIRWPDDQVLVWDNQGEMPEALQGSYPQVRAAILALADSNTVFQHADDSHVYKSVSREAW